MRLRKQLWSYLVGSLRPRSAIDKNEWPACQIYADRQGRLGGSGRSFMFQRARSPETENDRVQSNRTSRVPSSNM